jgi:hypothetical protein
MRRQSYGRPGSRMPETLQWFAWGPQVVGGETVAVGGVGSSWGTIGGTQDL